MIVYIYDPKNNTRKLLHLINTLSKVSTHQNRTKKKQCYFIHIREMSREINQGNNKFYYYNSLKNIME